jgi:hypothetical protein
VKAGFKMTEEKKGERNAFGRRYETNDYMVVLSYTGDVEEEEERDYAFQLGIVKKNTPCK